MRRIITIVFFALILILSLTAVMAVPAAAVAAVIHDYHNTGDDTYTTLHTDYWRSQSFTASSDYAATSIKLKIACQGNPGDITVSIRNADIWGEPLGADLNSGTIDGNTITDDMAGAWYSVNLLTPLHLDSDSKYAIVVRAVNGDTSNKVYWLGGGTYDQGWYGLSQNSGDSWTTFGHMDLMFEVWGISDSSDPTTDTTTAVVGGEVFPSDKGLLTAPWVILAAILSIGVLILIRGRRI
jgi:hypothetical protein